MEEKPIPSESRCPNCRSKPTNESVTEHRLSTLGYKHDDVFLMCSDCQTQWTHGVPIGEGGENDLQCDSCLHEYMRVHRVRVNERDLESIDLHLKCPKCVFFKIVPRDLDEYGVSLVGYPDITGEQSDAEPYGY